MRPGQASSLLSQNSGKPDTLCHMQYIGCKATAADLCSGRLQPVPDTPSEWAQAAHRQRLSGEKVQYILGGQGGQVRGAKGCSRVLFDLQQMLADVR